MYALDVHIMFSPKYFELKKALGMFVLHVLVVRAGEHF